MAFSRTHYHIIGRRALTGILVAVLAAVGMLTWLLAELPSAAVTTAAAERKIPIYCTDRPNKVVSLTFDAAWGNEDTQTLIDIFEQYGIHVTFFVVGEWADRCSDSVKALHAAGHEVMNHSATHPHMPQLSASEMLDEIRVCNEKIESLTGKKPTLFRAPYGDYDNTLIETLENQQMQCVQWDVDSLDWKDLSPEAISDRVLSRVRSGSIVLFHNAAKHTPEALPTIIEALQKDGYTFLRASEMVYPLGTAVNHEGRQIGADAESSDS
ncbi:MAG: polysaccharide deacetylase family protein [Clostridia bacterium]|nr:polysaccharide deacetylase family protein [Clostridia bacterium]